MTASPDRIDALLQRPAESLNVELKNWIDPRTPEGKAKIVKAVFALRNRNGGFFTIGWNNDSLSADPYTLDVLPETLFHPDKMQELISGYAHEPFEVTVEFRSLNEQIHPVIVVPEGVKIPTSVKGALNGAGGKLLLAPGAIYFRTLNANGVPSSAIVQPRDLSALLDICFDNREADIGRFFRRQLASADSAKLVALLTPTPDPSENLMARAFAVIKDGERSFMAALQEQPLPPGDEPVLQKLTMKVGLALDPKKNGSVPNQTFLNLVAGANPQYTGWPVWIDTRSFNDKSTHPQVVEGAWQTFIRDLHGSWFQNFEFMRLNPEGEFFLRRTMQDDLSEKVPPGTVLDKVLMIYRVAEVLAVGISIARASGWTDDGSSGFAFEWSGLEGRRLNAWASPMRSFGGGGGQSNSKTAKGFARIPLDTPHSALAPHVATIVAPLFASFNGAEVSLKLIEECVQQLIERKIPG